MKNTKASCLVIGDGIKGMQNQSIALGKSLGLRPSLLEVKPFWLTRYLPILFAGRFNIPLSNDDALLLSVNYDILITCGSRFAGISIGLKRYYLKAKRKLFTIHIQNPGLSPEHFDLLIVPEHDNITGENIIISKGSLHEVNKDNIKNSFKNLKSKTLKHLTDHIVVLVGGDTKRQKFTKDAVVNFLNEIKRMQKIFGSSVFISLSRRTPDFFSSLIIDVNIPKTTVWDPKENEDNPYPGIINKAKFILVTTDSINMLSEATSSGKAVYGYDIIRPNKRKEKFIEFLISKKLFSYSSSIKKSNSIFKVKGNIDNEVDRIGKLIKNNYLINN